MDDLISRKSLLEKTHMADVLHAIKGITKSVEVVLADDVEAAPSAFEGMTNREVLKALFPIDENSGTRFIKVYLDHESIESFEFLTTQKWLDSPYKGVSE